LEAYLEDHSDAYEQEPLLPAWMYCTSWLGSNT
jgi:hypothetical protein